MAAAASPGKRASAGTSVHPRARPDIAGEAVVIPSRTTKHLQTGRVWPYRGTPSQPENRSEMSRFVPCPPSRAFPALSSVTKVPANGTKADARTRTGDPFITRERRVRNARTRSSARGHVLAGSGQFPDLEGGRACPPVPALTHPFCSLADAKLRCHTARSLGRVLLLQSFASF
jgi:hypothetical protein